MSKRTWKRQVGGRKQEGWCVFERHIFLIKVNVWRQSDRHYGGGEPSHPLLLGILSDLSIYLSFVNI